MLLFFPRNADNAEANGDGAEANLGALVAVDSLRSIPRRRSAQSSARTPPIASQNDRISQTDSNHRLAIIRRPKMCAC